MRERRRDAGPVAYGEKRWDHILTTGHETPILRSMSSVPVVFYTNAHRIAGTVTLRERLSEALNDPLTDYLEVAEATISSLRAPESTEVQWPTATIPKKTLLVATLDLSEHESMATRIDKGQRKKVGSEVGAIVDSVEIYGTAHLIFQGSPMRVLANQLSVFFPVTDATIILSQRTESNRIETHLALVNRDKIEAFTIP